MTQSHEPGVPTPVHTDRAPGPRGAYSQAIRVGPWLLTSGLGPRDPESGQLVDADIATQTHRVLQNMQAVVEAGGGSMRDVVRVTTYLADLQRDFRGFDEAYGSWWGSVPPTRTTVGATLNGILVELDAVAYIPGG